MLCRPRSGGWVHLSVGTGSVEAASRSFSLHRWDHQLTTVAFLNLSNLVVDYIETLLEARILYEDAPSSYVVSRQSGSNFRVVNTVVSVMLTGLVDVEKLSLLLPGTQYEPEAFPGLIMRRSDLTATLVVFSTGRFVAIAPSVSSGVHALRAVANEISDIENQPVSFESTKVENMVATTDLESKIDLANLALANTNCIYEPEQFPAAICRLDGSVVLLVFGSGKVNCVGARSKAEISGAISWIRERLNL